MGFAIARAAAARGHRVTLVAGPVTLRTPPGVKRVDVVSAREMLSAAKREMDAGAEALVAVAAVADWRPRRTARHKLHKHEMAATLALVRNPDILKTLSARRYRAPRPVFVGFAAETRAAVASAAAKCRAKRLDLVVANDVTQPGAGFAADTNRVTLVRPDGSGEAWPLMTKLALARRLVREVERLGAGREKV